MARYFWGNTELADAEEARTLEEKGFDIREESGDKPAQKPDQSSGAGNGDKVEPPKPGAATDKKEVK